MSEAGERLIEAAKAALAIARGRQPAPRIYVNGYTYIPVPTDTKPTRHSMNGPVSAGCSPDCRNCMAA